MEHSESMQRRGHCQMAHKALLFVTGLLALAGAWGGDLHAQVRDGKGQPVADAVVVATPLDGALMSSRKPAAQIVDQVNKEFVPYVKPIYVGSLVNFPNKDNIRHHVYSFSATKRFELPLYAGTAAPPVIFDKPGVVVLGCNIHDWMLGYVYVADTPFFAKTDAQGLATLEGLPAGSYQVHVWHPDLDGDEKATARTMTIGAEDAAAKWVLVLKPSFRIPRPLGGHGAGYH